MIVTTSGRTNVDYIQLAKNIALNLNATYVDRNKKSISYFKKTQEEDILVVGKERFELYSKTEEDPFFFHPSSAMFRVKRLMNTLDDPFVTSTNLSEGKSFLDCTLGLASDSIVASFLVGETGNVTGIEGNPLLSFIVSKGLHSWDSGVEAINRAMRRINVKQNMWHLELQTLSSNSVDCVYIDPMFEESIEESMGIKRLRSFAVYQDIEKHMMEEAFRVATERVVLKDHFRSSRFMEFGFEVEKRKSAKFHYGVIKK